MKEPILTDFLTLKKGRIHKMTWYYYPYDIRELYHFYNRKITFYSKKNYTGVLPYLIDNNYDILVTVENESRILSLHTWTYKQTYQNLRNMLKRGYFLCYPSSDYITIHSMPFTYDINKQWKDEYDNLMMYVFNIKKIITHKLYEYDYCSYALKLFIQSLNPYLAIKIGETIKPMVYLLDILDKCQHQQNIDFAEQLQSHLIIINNTIIKENCWDQNNPFYTTYCSKRML